MKSLMQIRRVYLTLIEILIVISMMALAAGVIGVNVSKLMREQRFRSGVDAVADKLQMAENIMLIFGTDVTVTLIQKGDQGILCRITTDSTLPPSLERAINLSPLIPGIRAMAFGDPSRHQERVMLKFSSIAMAIPRGSLFFSSAPTFGRGDMQKEIYLPGFPSPIGTIAKPLQQESMTNESELLYPQEIRLEWQQRHQSEAPALPAS